MTDMMKDHVTIVEAARLLEVTRGAVWQAVKLKKLAAKWVPELKRWLIPSEALRKRIEEGGKGKKAEVKPT